MPPAKRRRLNARARCDLKPAEQAIRCRNELRRALARELAPAVSILPHRSQWATAVANLGRFVDQISVNTICSPPVSKEAAIWQITWCANATALLMGAEPPSGTGAAPHTAVLLASEQLVVAVERLAALRPQGLAALRPQGLAADAHLTALFNVLSPMLEIYELCCFLCSPDAQWVVFQKALTHPAQGGPADCLLMITPILLPNLVSSIRYVADQIAKNN
jgi:hypothetical protein